VGSCIRWARLAAATELIEQPGLAHPWLPYQVHHLPAARCDLPQELLQRVLARKAPPDLSRRQDLPRGSVPEQPDRNRRCLAHCETPHRGLTPCLLLPAVAPGGCSGAPRGRAPGPPVLGRRDRLPDRQRCLHRALGQLLHLLSQPTGQQEQRGHMLHEDTPKPLHLRG
jgi:hypothetical protein